MARDVYYQNVDNPIQEKLLPRREAEVAAPCAPLSRRETFLILVNFPFMLTFVAFLAAFANNSAKASTLVVVTLLVVLACVFLLWAYQGREIRPWSIQLIVIAIAATCYVLRPPCLLLCVLALILLGWLTVQFGRHWAAICTASPFPRPAASQCMRSWTMSLILIGASPLLAFSAGKMFGKPELAGCILLGLLAVQCFHRLPAHCRRDRLMILAHAILIWFTYNSSEIARPGLLKSPAGTYWKRLLQTYLAVFAAASALASGLDELCAAARSTYLTQELFSPDFLPFLQLATVLCVPATFLIIMMSFVMSWPILTDAAAIQDDQPDAPWDGFVQELQDSVNPIERRSIFMGILSDGCPLMVPRAIFRNHAHFLGDSGSGKTSKGLAPLMEQLGRSGNCSFILLDLKGDSMELYAVLLAVAEWVRRHLGRTIPVKHFTNQDQLSTFGFNPLMLDFWNDLDLYMKTDILCAAMGLAYGSDYGEGFYSSCNAAILFFTLQCYPNVRTFKELAEKMDYVLANAKKSELQPAIRDAGSHVSMVLKRIGSLDAMSVSRTSGHPQDVVAESINLANVFQVPEFHYFHLSSTLAPGFSPEIARLVTYSLLGAATRVKRNTEVYLVIDEFQRMVAQNLEYLLQLARSFGVGVILANQSMEDLRKGTSNFIPAVEANCRYRQWFSVSSSDDRKRLSESSGEIIDELATIGSSWGPQGRTDSASQTELILPRLSTNDILLASDHPSKSIVTITRGEDYAAFGGFPFVVESDFHISEEEFRRRQATPWPDTQPGSYVPREHKKLTDANAKPLSTGPIVTTEVIGDDDILPPPRMPDPDERSRKRKERGR